MGHKSPPGVIGVVADGAAWQYQVIDEPGSELTCHVITEADDDNKTDEDGQNISNTCCSPGGKSVFNLVLLLSHRSTNCMAKELYKFHIQSN